ncbi:unnamed protein product [Cylindrotheca closterium]|uniref:Uncharacterized protein n=1 Tax=Cylindrotheca closterium TaxID=2856 RepID=A0AAD2CSJ3_9STRA|nr:unnamed protein product [Cylindrotheca closterium]
MIQQDDYSPYNQIVRDSSNHQHEMTSAFVARTTSNRNDNHAANDTWKRNVGQTTASPLGVDDDRVWKRQRCGYHEGEAFNDGAIMNRHHHQQEKYDSFDGMDDATMGNATAEAANNANTNTNDKRKEPSNGICFMMAPKQSSTTISEDMAIDDELDAINPQDYFEDKWH